MHKLLEAPRRDNNQSFIPLTVTSRCMMTCSSLGRLEDAVDDKDLWIIFYLYQQADPTSVVRRRVETWRSVSEAQGTGRPNNNEWRTAPEHPVIQWCLPALQSSAPGFSCPFPPSPQGRANTAQGKTIRRFGRGPRREAKSHNERRCLGSKCKRRGWGTSVTSKVSTWWRAGQCGWRRHILGKPVEVTGEEPSMEKTGKVWAGGQTACDWWWWWGGRAGGRGGQYWGWDRTAASCFDLLHLKQSMHIGVRLSDDED